MKCASKTLVVLLLLAGAGTGFSQSFVNLNFESANVSAYGAGPASVPVTNAIPGWVAYVDGNQQTYMVYNSISLGAPQVSLESTSGGFNPIQGNYFISLRGGNGGPGTSAAVGQTGEVPLSTQSISYWGIDGGLDVTFDGQPLSFVQTGNGPNYSIYVADISQYAGDTGQLLFTVDTPSYALIDNIQFSPSPIPEPGALSLSALGGLFLAWRRWKYRSP